MYTYVIAFILSAAFFGIVPNAFSAAGPLPLVMVVAMFGFTLGTISSMIVAAFLKTTEVVTKTTALGLMLGNNGHPDAYVIGGMHISDEEYCYSFVSRQADGSYKHTLLVAEDATVVEDPSMTETGELREYQHQVVDKNSTLLRWTFARMRAPFTRIEFRVPVGKAINIAPQR